MSLPSDRNVICWFNCIPCDCKTSNNESKTAQPETQQEPSTLSSPSSTKEKTSDDKLADDRVRLAPPVLLRISFERSLWGVDTLVAALAVLSNEEVLKEARAFSLRFDLSIYQWQGLLYRLYQENQDRRIQTAELKDRTFTVLKGDKKWHVKNATFQYLTLENIRELSSYQLPSISDVEIPLTEQTRFSLSPTALSLSLAAAPLFVEFVLLFSLIYFWLFQCEAQRSESYPAPATLFGVLYRTPLSQGIFFLLILIPPFAAAMLAMRSLSNTLLNVFIALMVLVIAFLISCSFVHRP